MGSWWLGVIPAVVAVGLLMFWFTGQFEEMFGIDPRGTWRAVTAVYDENQGPPPGESTPLGRKPRWELLIDDAAGELWIKLYRDREEVLAGPLLVNENNIYYDGPRGSFNGVYYTNAARFRYHPFAQRYIDCVIRLGPGNAYALKFMRE
jgi:hypothetical protein